ncbi:MAG: hypothetical protein AAGC73_07130 [Verrucomicrobiota bacterium]
MTQATQGFFAVTLWYKPGRTMQGLIEQDKGHGCAVLLAAIFGIVQSWRFYAADDSQGLVVLGLGALVGVGALFFFAWLLRNFSRWFGASVPIRHVRLALGLSLLPWTLMFAVLIGMLGQAPDASAIAGYFPVFFAVFLYGYILLLLSLSSVLNLSFLKTFLCLVITTLVSFFPITLILQLMVGVPATP